MEEPVECSDCGGVAATTKKGKPKIKGWDMDGEFGPRCPSCSRNYTNPNENQGIAGIAEAVGAAADPVAPKRRRK